MRFLVIVLMVSIVSCKKDSKPKIEKVSEVETRLSEDTKETSQKEVQNAMEGLFKNQIDMEVDKTVFVIDKGNSVNNRDMSAGIMKMLAPQSYESFKARMMKQPMEENGVTSTGIEEIELGGRKMLVQKSKTVDQQGAIMKMVMYAIPAGEKTMMISSYFMGKEEAKYLPLIEKAVATAKLKNRNTP